MTVYSISGNNHCLDPEGAWRKKLLKGKGLWRWGQEIWNGRVWGRGCRENGPERMGGKDAVWSTRGQHSRFTLSSVLLSSSSLAEPKKLKDKGAYWWWEAGCWFVLCRAVSLDTAAGRKMALGQPAEDISLAFPSSSLPSVGHIKLNRFKIELRILTL